MSADDGLPPNRSEILTSGRALAGLSLVELWAACIAIGDRMSEAEIEQALAGRIQLTDHRYDIVAHALNDRLVDMGLDHVVPYASELPAESA